MTSEAHDEGLIFVFGQFRLVPNQQLLLRNWRPVKLGTRALDLLLILVRNAGNLVTKEALVEFVWPHTFVDERNLKVHVSSLRRALEETWPHRSFIATVAGRGYRFVSPVRTENMLPGDLVWADAQLLNKLPPRRAIIGREDEVGAVERALHGGSLVTLAGPGGVGKTSIGIEVAHRMRAAADVGCCFVDLSTTDDLALVPHLIATALGLHGGPGEIAQRIADYLNLNRLLVFLDNCERTLPAVTALLRRVAEGGPTASVLVTSRETLGLEREHVHRVSPLRFPPEPDTADHASASLFPATAMFLSRASEVAGYTLVSEDIAPIVRLCQALDGLPLAIELAAAKLDQFTPLQLLQSLHDRFALLRNDRQIERHDALWSTIDWSFKLLSAQEAEVLKLVSVFSSAFELKDIVAMAKLGKLDPFEITVAVAGLVRKSLVVALLQEDSPSYRLLESTRLYAADRLRLDPELNARAQAHHAMLTLTLFEQAEKEWNWVETSFWRRRYERRIGDLRKALDWCFDALGDAALGVKLTASAIRLWNEQSSVFEQMYQVERALEHKNAVPRDATELARLAVSRAWSLTLARDLGSAAERAWETAIELACDCTDPIFRLSALSGSAIYYIYTGRNDLAVDRLRMCRDLASRHRDQGSVIDSERRSMLAEMHLGRLMPVRNKLETFSQALRTGMPPSRIVRYKEERYISIHTTLSFLYWLTGSPSRAIGLAREMVVKTAEAGQLMGQSNVLCLVFLPIAYWLRDDEALGEAAALLRGNVESGNVVIWEPVCRFYEAATRHLQGDRLALPRMQAAVEDLIRDHMVVRTPMYLAIIAEALLARGAVPQAAKVIERAIKQHRRCQERWCLPELMRIKAAILSAEHSKAKAEAMLWQAGQTANEMGAAFFSLRIANDLVSQAKSETALAQATRWLTAVLRKYEGENSIPDTHRAHALLTAH